MTKTTTTETEQHTPGPWTATVTRYPNGEFHGEPYIYAPQAQEHPTEGRHVATLCRLYEAEANASLIAAAPDLLAALTAIHDLPANDEGERTIPAGFLDEARAAIAKATGGES